MNFKEPFRLVTVVKIVALLLLARSVESIVTSTDLARRFGVPESSLASSSKHSWKVECSESSNDFFDRFRDIDEVNDFLETTLAKKFTGRISSLGTTVEGREIKALTIGSSGSNSAVILAMAGLHGREWTSIAALLFAVHMMSPEDLKDVTLTVVPVVNPDGYAKTFDGGTHTKERYRQGVGVETDADQPNRYWRKNGNGVDLNRNFGANFYNDTKKSSKIKQSDVYPGSGPFSEKETKALRDWAKMNIDRLQAIIDFHCCIGAVLGPPIPPGTSKASAADNERVGLNLVSALSDGGKGVTRTVKGGDGFPGAYEWRARSAKDPGAGLSASWGFLDLFVDLTFVVEMRGKFVAPCFEIKQLGKEALFGIRALVNEVSSRSVLSLQDRKRIRVQPASSSGSIRGGRGATISDGGLSLVSLLIFLVSGGIIGFLYHQKRRGILIAPTLANRKA